MSFIGLSAFPHERRNCENAGLLDSWKQGLIFTVWYKMLVHNTNKQIILLELSSIISRIIPATMVWTTRSEVCPQRGSEVTWLALTGTVDTKFSWSSKLKGGGATYSTHPVHVSFIRSVQDVALIIIHCLLRPRDEQLP